MTLTKQLILLLNIAAAAGTLCYVGALTFSGFGQFGFNSWNLRSFDMSKSFKRSLFNQKIRRRLK